MSRHQYSMSMEVQTLDSLFDYEIDVGVDPHIGHMHSMIMADIHTRYKLLWKKSALLATGTDEHGIKVISPELPDILIDIN
jgi:tRNA synthetases class I (M)